MPIIPVHFPILVGLLRTTMNAKEATTEGMGRLPSKGPLSIHQKALFVFWVSVVSLAAFRKLLVLLKVPSLRTAFRPMASGMQEMVVYFILFAFLIIVICS